MDSYIRITVPLRKNIFTALRENAAKEYREPRQQAAYILERALGIADDQSVEPSIKATNGDSLELETSVAM